MMISQGLFVKSLLLGSFQDGLTFHFPNYSVATLQHITLKLVQTCKCHNLYYISFCLWLMLKELDALLKNAFYLVLVA